MAIARLARLPSRLTPSSTRKGGPDLRYVAIGRAMSTIVNVVRPFEAGAMAYTIVVVASASNRPRCTLSAYWAVMMVNTSAIAARDALIVYDDLSKQAVAYRQISPVAPPPAGPRSISRATCSPHVRLLERAARLKR